jgi:hypothetical protein
VAFGDGENDKDCCGGGFGSASRADEGLKKLATGSAPASRRRESRRRSRPT